MATPAPPLPDGTETPPTPDLSAIQARIQAQDSELRQLRAKVDNPPPPPPPAPDPKTQEDELTTSFWKEPLKVSAAISQRAAYEAAAQTMAPHMDALVELARSTVRNKDPKNFDKYLGEIEGRLAQVHPQFRTNVGVWQAAFDAIKGSHMNEIIAAARAEGAPTPRGGDGPAPPSPRAPSAPTVAELSADESAMAKFLGLSADEYRHGKAILEDPDKHWGEVITFDSDEARKRKRNGAK